MILREVLIQYEIVNDKSHEEMANSIGVSLSTYYRWLKGESTKLKKTTIDKLSNILECDVERILEETDRVKPILGKAKAGYGLWAEEDFEGYFEVGKADANKGDYFLRVKGDSMEGSHIFDGDLIYVKQTNQVESGNIAVVLVGDEVTIKTVYYRDNNMILEASNPKYESRHFGPEAIEQLPVQIIGQVIFVRTDF